MNALDFNSSLAAVLSFNNAVCNLTAWIVAAGMLISAAFICFYIVKRHKKILKP